MLEITIMMALMLLINNKYNNRNSEKNIESCGIITNAIATQLLENVIIDKIKIFDTK